MRPDLSGLYFKVVLAMERLHFKYIAAERKIIPFKNENFVHRHVKGVVTFPVYERTTQRRLIKLESTV